VSSAHAFAKVVTRAHGPNIFPADHWVSHLASLSPMRLVSLMWTLAESTFRPSLIDWGAPPPEGRNGTEGPVIARDGWFCEQLDKNPKPWMRQKGLVNLRMWILLKTRYFIQMACNSLYLYKNVKMNRKWNLIGFKIFRKSSQVQYGRYFLVSIGYKKCQFFKA
jgi:hypothetical protein